MDMSKGSREQEAKPADGKPVQEVPASLSAPAVDRSNAAAFALWGAFTHPANFVASPHSIRSALGLVYLGSLDGVARRSLRAALVYPERNEDLDIRLLDSTVQTSDQARFESANAIWIASERTLRDTYKDAVSRTLPAEVRSIDFASDPEPARVQINAWVSERTRGKIPEAIQPSAISKTTQVVLVNAVYFFGRWSSPFTRKLTARKPFRTAQGATVNVDMMVGASCRAEFADEYRVAYADYAGTSIIFVVVVPKHWQEFRWDASAFGRVWAAFSRAQEAALELPRFGVRSQSELVGVMHKLDLDLRDPRLLSGVLTSGEPGKIDLASHEAFIQVDETSTEAAAVTAIGRLKDEEHAPPPVFRVDRPFYFLLVERRTGLILFMGQVTNPAAAGGAQP
jgi:serpin B